MPHPHRISWVEGLSATSPDELDMKIEERIEVNSEADLLDVKYQATTANGYPNHHALLLWQLHEDEEDDDA